MTWMMPRIWMSFWRMKMRRRSMRIRTDRIWQWRQEWIWMPPLMMITRRTMIRTGSRNRRGWKNDTFYGFPL